MQIHPLAHSRSRAPRTIERFCVAYQDTQRAFGHRSGNANRNPAHNAVAPIWAQNSFNRDLIAWTRFRHVSAGAFQYGSAAFRLKVELKIYAADCGSFKRIVIDASKVIAQ